MYPRLWHSWFTPECPKGFFSTFSMNLYGGFLKWWYSQITNFNRVFHYKPSILGYHHFRKHPYTLFFFFPPSSRTLAVRNLRGGRMELARRMLDTMSLWADWFHCYLDLMDFIYVQTRIKRFFSKTSQKYTFPKFTRSPLKSYIQTPNRKAGSSSNHRFSGAMLWKKIGGLYRHATFLGEKTTPR